MRQAPLAARLLASVAGLVASSAFLSAQCGITQPLGTNIGAGDDTVSAAQALGFNFPFNGNNYDTIFVSSNGFVYLGTASTPQPTNSLCCNGVSGTLLASTLPMICGLWMDLYPPGAGSVNFNTFTSPNRATITWDQVPEYVNQGSNTFQITLTDTGEIDFYWSPGVMNLSHTMLVGWSQGGGAADPGATDFSTAPLSTSAITAYQLFNAGTFDMAGNGFAAIPTGSNYLVVPAPCARTATYGQGCPQPATMYEDFPGSAFDLSGTAIHAIYTGGGYLFTNCSANCWEPNFTGALALTDDSLATGLALGFTMPFFGGGSTSTIDVCSNGYIWMNSGSSTSADFSPSVAELLSNPARLCPLWFDFNPSAGGTIYFDTFPGRAVVTWNGVYAFGTTSPNTMQIQLFQNGDFIVNWQSVTNNSSTNTGAALFGYSQGNGSVDPGNRDVSASLPFSTGAGGTPVNYHALAGSRPVLGTTFTGEASDLPASTLMAIVNYGFLNPGIGLDFLGMTGCTLHADILFSLPVSLTLPTGTSSFRVPNLPTIIGASINSQCVGVAPGVNTANLFASNGLTLTFGN